MVWGWDACCRRRSSALRILMVGEYLDDFARYAPNWIQCLDANFNGLWFNDATELAYLPGSNQCILGECLIDEEGYGYVSWTVTVYYSPPLVQWRTGVTKFDLRDGTIIWQNEGVTSSPLNNAISLPNRYYATRMRWLRNGDLAFSHPPLIGGDGALHQGTNIGLVTRIGRDGYIRHLYNYPYNVDGFSGYAVAPTRSFCFDYDGRMYARGNGNSVDGYVAVWDVEGNYVGMCTIVGAGDPPYYSRGAALPATYVHFDDVTSYFGNLYTATWGFSFTVGHDDVQRDYEYFRSFARVEQDKFEVLGRAGRLDFGWDNNYSTAQCVGIDGTSSTSGIIVATQQLNYSEPDPADARPHGQGGLQVRPLAGLSSHPRDLGGVLWTRDTAIVPEVWGGGADRYRTRQQYYNPTTALAVDPVTGLSYMTMLPLQSYPAEQTQYYDTIYKVDSSDGLILRRGQIPMRPFHVAARTTRLQTTPLA